MKKNLLIGAVALMVLTMGTAVYAANSTTNAVTVQTNVLGKCYFNTASSTLTIPDIDPSSLVNATGTATLGYACTKHTTAPTLSQSIGTSGCAGASAVSFGADLYLKGTANSECLKYNLTGPALTADGFGTYNSETITATIVPGSFNNVSADAYTDTVTLTVNY